MEYLAQRGFKKDFIAEGKKYPSGTVSLILDFYRDRMVLIQEKKKGKRDKKRGKGGGKREKGGGKRGRKGRKKKGRK